MLLPSFLRVILFLRRSKCSVRTVCRAVVVRCDNAEMIGGARTQAADVGADVQICVASLTLHRRGEPVACRRVVLKVNPCGPSVRINYSVKCG